MHRAAYLPASASALVLLLLQVSLLWQLASHAMPLLTAGTLQSFMLDEGHLGQLKLDTQIEPQHFEQYEAEAVFIPAGCPHQVRQGFGLGGDSTWLTFSGGVRCCWLQV